MKRAPARTERQSSSCRTSSLIAGSRRRPDARARHLESEIRRPRSRLGSELEALAVAGGGDDDAPGSLEDEALVGGVRVDARLDAAESCAESRESGRRPSRSTRSIAAGSTSAPVRLRAGGGPAGVEGGLQPALRGPSSANGSSPSKSISATGRDRGLGEVEVGHRLDARRSVATLDPRSGEQVTAPRPRGDDRRRAEPVTARGLDLRGRSPCSAMPRTRSSPWSSAPAVAAIRRRARTGAVGVDHARLGLVEQRSIVGEVDPEAVAGASAAERKLGRDAGLRGGPAARARRSRRGSARRFAAAASRRPRPRSRASAPAPAGRARGRTRRGRRRGRRSARRPCWSPARPLRPRARRRATPAPRRAAARAVAAPTMPPPMTRTSASVRSRCCVRPRQVVYDRTVHMYTPNPPSRQPTTDAGPRTRPGRGRAPAAAPADDAAADRRRGDRRGHAPVGGRGGGRPARLDHLLVLARARRCCAEALEHFARLEIETLHERLDGRARQAALAPPAGRRVHRPADRAARRAALADRRAVRAAPGGRPPARARGRLPRVDARPGSRRSPSSSSPSAATDPELEARMFLAMLDGLLLGQLAAPDPRVRARRPAARAAHVVRPDPGGEADDHPPDLSSRRRCALAPARSLLGGMRLERRRSRRAGRRTVPIATAEGKPSGDLTISNWALYIDKQTDPRVRAADRDQRRLRRGHQQLRRVLRQDAAAARQGRVGRAQSLMVANDWLAKQDVRPRLHPAARQGRARARASST